MGIYIPKLNMPKDIFYVEVSFYVQKKDAPLTKIENLLFPSQVFDIPAEHENLIDAKWLMEQVVLLFENEIYDPNVLLFCIEKLTMEAPTLIKKEDQL